MSVRCEECDALCVLEGAREVATPGLWAKCGQCGHRFDVSRGAYDRWVVVTPTGEELIFASIVDLKTAIDDRVEHTPPPRIDPPMARRLLPSVPPMSLEAGPRPSHSQVVPFDSDGALVAAVEQVADVSDSDVEMLVPSEPPSTLGAPTRPVRNSDSGSPDMSEAMRLASLARMLAEPMERLAITGRPPAAKNPLGWMVPALLLLGLALVGYVLYGPGAVNSANSTPVSPSSAAPRPEALLLEGEQALSEGNLEGASESFAKASAMVEKNPRLALDLARLATAKADVPWLKLRVLSSDATEEHRTARDLLTQLATKAREAAEGAVALTPNDIAAARVKLDALRVGGEVDAAKEMAAAVLAGIPSEPETAYVLAALDLAQPGPVSTSAIDRLHIAALGEGSLGRARALLVYALSRVGEFASAKRELEFLASGPRPHPLTPFLRVFLANATSPAVGTPHPKTNLGTKKSGDLAQQAADARKSGDLAKARALYASLLSRNGTDVEGLWGMAETSRASGDRTAAASYYKSAIALNPSFLPAQLGSADSMWEGGDRAEAQKKYQMIAETFPARMLPDRVKERAK